MSPGPGDTHVSWKTAKEKLHHSSDLPNKALKKSISCFQIFSSNRHWMNRGKNPTKPPSSDEKDKFSKTVTDARSRYQRKNATKIRLAQWISIVDSISKTSYSSLFPSHTLLPIIAKCSQPTAHTLPELAHTSPSVEANGVWPRHWALGSTQLLMPASNLLSDFIWDNFWVHAIRRDWVGM